ncbi:hypothetical protein ACIQWR_12370 [Streptomyces sp. NPDC098789]|uniref:hypothetical protein n=1 Tax=Streptomyces sp. NPDC098789 TaxID=3366098 RepID=UPI00382C2F94
MTTLTCGGPPGNRRVPLLRPSTPAVRWAAALVGERSNGAVNGRPSTGARYRQEGESGATGGAVP